MKSGPLLLTLLVLALGLPLAQGAASGAAELRYVAHGGVLAAGPPVADGVRTGNTLYLAGHLGIDPCTGQVPVDRGTEARLLMESVRRTVLAAGLRMDDLVSVTVFSTDPALNETFDAVYRSYFHDRSYPARGFVGASSLQQGAHFEVLGVAVERPRLQL